MNTKLQGKRRKVERGKGRRKQCRGRKEGCEKEIESLTYQKSMEKDIDILLPL